MPQSIIILGGIIKVTMRAYFEPDVAPWRVIPVGKLPFENDYYATYQLGNKKWKANLKIWAMIEFPQHTWRTNGHESPPYHQLAECAFTNITHDDGTLTFSDIGPVKLQIHPYMGNWIEKSEDSLFRFIDGSALLSASNNPRIPVIKIKMVLGSPDVYVIDKRVEEKEAEWKFGVEGGKKSNGSGPDKAGIDSYIWDAVKWGGGKVVDLVRSLEFNVGIERTGGGTSTQTGQSRTFGKLSEQPEWTLSLELPEPTPKPQPIAALTWHSVYFLTGKKDLIGQNNVAGKFPDSKDQIKSLQEFMNGIYGRYGYKNISSIELEGHASGLGDSAGNLTLSSERAQYVKTLLGKMYSEIPQSAIFAKGAPPEKNNKDDDPYDRRVVIRVSIKDKDKRML